MRRQSPSGSPPCYTAQLLLVVGAREPSTGAVQAMTMATPASSPIPLMLSATAAAAASSSSSPMSYFSYRGAGLEMADDEVEEDESTTTANLRLAPQGASSFVSSARVAPPPSTTLLPSRLPTGDRQRFPLPMMRMMSTTTRSSSTTTKPSGPERSRPVGDEESPPPRTVEPEEENFFEGIEAIPHCDDYEKNNDKSYNDSYRNNRQQMHSTPGEEEKKQQEQHFSEASIRSSGNVVPGIVGRSEARPMGADPNPRTDSDASALDPTKCRDDGGSGGNTTTARRNPTLVSVVDADDEEGDDDDNDNRPDNGGRPQGYHHKHNDDEDEDDFIKSLFDQAVDAPCQRLTVAPCMADLMDRQLDLFMRCRQPLEFLSLFRDDHLDPDDDELQRTWHGVGGDPPYPLLSAVAPGAYVLPTSCEYCGATHVDDCDPHRCQRPRLFFAKRRPPFANAVTADAFFDPVTDDAY